jgi:hypothetical protein
MSERKRAEFKYDSAGISRLGRPAVEGGFLTPPGDHPPLGPPNQVETKREAGRFRTIWGPGLTKTQAEELLDWLETHGCEEREVVYEEGRGFTVLFTAEKSFSLPWPLWGR